MRATFFVCGKYFLLRGKLPNMKFYALKNSILLPLLLVALWTPPTYAEQATQPPSLETVFELELADETPVAFQSLAQMDELVQLGMPALALRLLNQEQQNQPIYSSEWYAFERKRITLLSALEDWQGMIERIDVLLHEADSAHQISIHITRWFSTQQIMARLRLGQAEQALAQLRTLLWQSSRANLDLNYSDMVALWRRLVIRAYLAMNADHDAQIALLRYQHDYSRDHRNLNMDWRLLQARSLLRTGRAEETMALLVDSPLHIAQALRLLAGLRAHPDKAGQYAQQAQTSLGQEKMNAGEIWAYRYVLYQAYLSQEKLSAATEVLKELLVQREAHAFMGEEFNVSSDNLWQLYQSIGRALGNRSKLLLGDDLAWYKKAGELQKKNQTVEALSLYAVLAFNAHDIEKKQTAHKEIVALLANDKNGLELVNQLYLHTTKITSLKSLPLEVRYSLLDYALSKSDTKLAVRLMQSVRQPPQGQEVFAWEMRKARVMILEGAYAQGEAVLATTVKQTEQISPAQLDQFLQVIFDLQAVGRHVQVLVLLNSLKPEWLDQALHRELFFWKAESYAALEQYERAAWSYLKSAQLADETEVPMWAQSARFNAAGVLVKSRLYDDARLIYNGLMPVTASDSRKAAIRQQLQHIRLLRNAEKNRSDEH